VRVFNRHTVGVTWAVSDDGQWIATEDRAGKVNTSVNISEQAESSSVALNKRAVRISPIHTSLMQ